MDNIKTTPHQPFQKQLSEKLSRTCNRLQELEQRMTLIAHKSQKIAAKMKRIRQQLPQPKP